jgi:hypothetical protein
VIDGSAIALPKQNIRYWPEVGGQDSLLSNPAKSGHQASITEVFFNVLIFKSRVFANKA